MHLLPRRIHAIALATLLVAAQCLALAHVVGHVADGDAPACFVCHAADAFGSALPSAAPALPVAPAQSAAIAAREECAPSAIFSAYHARAPPRFA
ncbi:MAG: hypothetical protein AB7Q97_18775 [Gammaproteobacteria bacterium]